MKTVTTPAIFSSICATFTCISCSEPLVAPQDIKELRVIAARVEPDSDPGRATLKPGERARATWLVVGPEGRAYVSHGLSACRAAPALRGMPECEGPLTASSTTETPELDPTLAFDVPSGEKLLLSAVFCTRGAVQLDAFPDASHCKDDSAQQELATYEVPISETDPPNHHPDLTEIELRANGVIWPDSALNVGGAAGAGGAESDDLDACATEGALHVARGAKLNIDFTLPDEAREKRPASSVNVGAWETLQLSHLSTRGHFERPFTVFDAAATSLAGHIEWEAPSAPGAAQLYLVVRDLRGGVSVVTRSVCVND